MRKFKNKWGIFFNASLVIAVLLLTDLASAQAQSAVEVSLEIHSGIPNPGWIINTPAEIAQLQEFINGLPNAEPIPEPPFGAFLLLNKGITGFPQAVLVFGGVISVRSADGTEESFQDTKGLKDFLVSKALERGIWVPGGLRGDLDDDGVPDSEDGCPEDENKAAPGSCGCGIAETDTDGDGVANCIDNCLSVANPDQKDSNHDGVGDACTPIALENCGNCIDDNGDGLVDLFDPQCASVPMNVKTGRLSLTSKPDAATFTLQGTFSGAAGSINPPAEGVTLNLTDSDGQITCFNLPPGAGWKTTGSQWTFTDNKTGSLGKPGAKESFSLSFNAQTGVYSWKASVKKTNLKDPDAGSIGTALTIGDNRFLNNQSWQPKGKKLTTRSPG